MKETLAMEVLAFSKKKVVHSNIPKYYVSISPSLCSMCKFSNKS